MRKTIDLHKGWRFHNCNWNTGHTVSFATADTDDSWIEASVPGNVHSDCIRAGVIPDPYYSTNSNHCLWMETKDWWYRLDFENPVADPEGDTRILLDFEGLDTFATVFLNGIPVASHRNMFTPLRVDITRSIIPGKNLLAVRLASPMYEIRVSDSPELFSNPPERIYARKCQSCYGWDIAPRLVTFGIWRPVRLVVTDTPEFESISVSTLAIRQDAADMHATICISNPTGKPCTGSIRFTAGGGTGTIPFHCQGDSCSIGHDFVVANPRLWQPRGHGAPELYDFSATLEIDGLTADTAGGSFGIRTIELVQQPQSPGNRSFMFKVNGKPVFLKGMNWTPADALFTETSNERYTDLVTEAAGAGINALRVWGGGIYEPDIFYDLCDRHGILVWQDFMFACACYPQDPDFLAEVQDEAEYAVRRLRGHPCLMAWCGDNENDWLSAAYGVPGYRKNPTTKKILPDVVNRLSPGIPYVPSSPFSPELDDQNSDHEGDAHLWGFGELYDAPFYSERRPRMVTEMGQMCMPAMDVVRSFVPAQEAWPVLNDTWRMHSSDPLHVCWGDWRIKSIFLNIEKRGWPAPVSLDDLIEKSQLLQVEATRFWIRTYSSDPECWGIFLWNLADCWPQISSAYISYPLSPKPALQTVREEYAAIRR